MDVFEGLFPLAGIVPLCVAVEAVNLLLKDSLRIGYNQSQADTGEINYFQ